MTSNEMRSIGTRVREARKEANVSPEQLAVALGVSTATVFRIERDDSDLSVKRLEVIAKTTQKPIAYFLNGLAA